MTYRLRVTAEAVADADQAYACGVQSGAVIADHRSMIVVKAGHRDSSDKGSIR